MVPHCKQVQENHHLRCRSLYDPIRRSAVASRDTPLLQAFRGYFRWKLWFYTGAYGISHLDS